MEENMMVNEMDMQDTTTEEAQESSCGIGGLIIGVAVVVGIGALAITGIKKGYRYLKSRSEKKEKESDTVEDEVIDSDEESK